MHRITPYFALIGGAVMSEEEIKPLNWTPEPGIGYTVERRVDGGMHLTFSDVTLKTLNHWRDFSLQHLYNSDRLTRNLYDLRKISYLPEVAVQIALEVISDPATRNIKLAVIVSNEQVKQAVQRIADLTPTPSIEMRLFTELSEAEAWLKRPLTLIV
jgi:hypothetical protein